MVKLKQNPLERWMIPEKDSELAPSLARTWVFPPMARELVHLMELLKV